VIGYVSGSFRAWIEFLEFTKDEPIAKEIHSILAYAYPELFANGEPAAEPQNTRICLFATYDYFKNDVKRSVPIEQQDDILSKHLPHTVIFVCDRGVSHEFVRHRPSSFAQESTRYCNYANEKFGDSITVIRPCFWNQEAIDTDTSSNLQACYDIWVDACEKAEAAYFALIAKNAVAQQARDVLPQSVKTELVITATENEWQHIIDLRYHGTTGAPHPQMKEVMTMAYPDLRSASENRLA
jgi:hypothetical protein